MKNKIIFIIAIVLVMVLGGWHLLSTKEQATPAKEKIVLKAGYLDLPNALFLAQEKGFFAQANLNVQLEKFSNSNLMLEALERGDIAVTSEIGYSTLFAFENRKGGVFKVYAGYTETPDTNYSAIVIKKNSGLSTVAKLEGKKIVIASGKSPQSQTELIIKALDLDLSQIELVPVDRSLILPTFAKPEIAAFVGTEPAITLLTEKADGEVLVSNPRVKYIMNPYEIAGAVLSTKLLSDKPEIVRTFLKAINLAIDFIDANEVESRKTFGQYLRLEESIASKMGLPQFKKSSAIDKTAVDKFATLEVEAKIIEKKPDINKLFLAD